MLRPSSGRGSIECRAEKHAGIACDREFQFIPITSINVVGSAHFSHPFDFAFAYWVRVELERATTSQTVIFYSIALEEVFFSDIRLKHNVALLGQLDNGLGLYRFSYHGSDAAYVGVMAQEVEAVIHDAVVRGSDGYLRVYYNRLGLRMQSWEDWVASGEIIPATARHAGKGALQ